MDEKQLQKLIKKNSEKAEKARKRPPARTYDPTLTRKETDDADLEREDFFDEMKRREF
jgi:hypothetical protein